MLAGQWDVSGQRHSPTGAAQQEEGKTPSLTALKMSEARLRSILTIFL